MTLSQSRSTYSWQGAIALGPHLVSLAEALPSHEQNGLVTQLQHLMVELPAMVAHDLVQGGELRHDSVYRLSAALELIDRVYPALDGADARTALDALAERLSGPNFNETVASATSTPLPPLAAEEPVPAAVADAPAEAPAEAPAPVTQTEPLLSGPIPDTITISPAFQQEQAIHVQPSSGQ